MVIINLSNGNTDLTQQSTPEIWKWERQTANLHLLHNMLKLIWTLEQEVNWDR